MEAELYENIVEIPHYESKWLQMLDKEDEEELFWLRTKAICLIALITSSAKFMSAKTHSKESKHGTVTCFNSAGVF